MQMHLLTLLLCASQTPFLLLATQKQVVTVEPSGLSPTHKSKARLLLVRDARQQQQLLALQLVGGGSLLP